MTVCPAAVKEFAPTINGSTDARNAAARRTCRTFVAMVSDPGRCRECGGSEICVHDRRVDVCVTCGGEWRIKRGKKLHQNQEARRCVTVGERLQQELGKPEGRSC